MSNLRTIQAQAKQRITAASYDFKIKGTKLYQEIPAQVEALIKKEVGIVIKSRGKKFWGSNDPSIHPNSGHHTLYPITTNSYLQSTDKGPLGRDFEGRIEGSYFENRISIDCEYQLVLGGNYGTDFYAVIKFEYDLGTEKLTKTYKI